MSVFSARLRHLRNNASLTQQQLADALGLAGSTISMYERGEREPDLETLETISNYFNVDMNYLTSASSQPSPSNLSIDQEVDRLLSGLKDSETLMLDGRPASAEAIQYLRNSLQANIEFARRLNDTAGKETAAGSGAKQPNPKEANNKAGRGDKLE